MQKLLLVFLFMASAATAASNGYQETRELRLDSGSLNELDIEAGAGSLQIIGVAGSGEISVTAVVRVPGRDEESSKSLMQSRMVLTLEKNGQTAALKSWFDSGFFGWGDSPAIDLVVHMPASMNLTVRDGSGSMDVRNVRGNLSLDDGSGSITLQDVGGDVRLEDGSGAISLSDAGGDVRIDDGSGEIRVRGVAGSVTIDDGSGTIDVSDVARDLVIVNDGSGGLKISNVAGRVETDT